MRGALEVAAGALIAGRYRVRRVLGQGGVGQVLLVDDEFERRTVALKRLLPAEGADAPTIEARFQFRREFHTLVSLRHPCIVAGYDYGNDRGLPHYTMELVDGADLRDAGVQEVRAVVAVMRDLASALSTLHSRSLVHRDLSLRNVRRTREGSIKLLDFGLICSSGARARPAGTPPAVAPEAVREDVLDHRVDVYGLGALAYVLLTGQHAYPARALADLHELWKRPFRPASAIRDGIPPALDELIGSMLALDPLGRPASMAEVLARLAALDTAARELPPAPLLVQGLAVVGRDVERRRVHDAIGALLDGRGGAVSIEAPSGLGKTRLLEDARVEAQLRGVRVVAVRGEAVPGRPYAVMQAVTRGVLEAAEEDALAAAGPSAPWLVQTLPDLAARLPDIAAEAQAGDPSEAGLQVQRALASWLLAIARRRPLVILVDDLQRGDAASVEVLAALARRADEAPLLVVSTLRTDDVLRAAAAVDRLRAAATRVPLQPLSAEDVERLARATLGDVPGAGKLARWLVDRGGGSPLLCRELLAWLADAGHLRLAHGSWVVASLPGRDDVPGVLADAMDARIRNLGPGARSLGEVLAVRGGVASLATCVALSGGMSEAGVFEALDELGGRGVLLGGEGKFAFRHDALREALLRNLDPVQRRVLHRRVAEHLLARDAPSADEAEVGWHLLHGGRAVEAAPLLHRAGRRLFESFSFPDSVPVLEAALTAYGADASPAAVLEVRKMLLGAAATCDRKLAARYAEETLVALRHWAGIDVAARWRGRRGLTLGLGVATSRWAASSMSKKTPTPVRALGDFVAAVAYATVHRAGTLDLVRARSLAEELRPFEGLDDSLLGGAYLLARSVVDLPLGHFGRIRQTIPTVLRVLGRDRQLRDFERRLGTGLVLYLRAMGAALDQLEEHEDDCRKIEALGPRFEVAAAVVRVAYRRGRGEETIARKLEREVEVLLAERGSGWTLESNVIWATVLGHALTRDVDGLRHAAEASARLHADGGCSLALAGLAEGEHLLARGNAPEAAIAFERALADLPAEDRIFRATTHAALAETALAIGDLESAIDRANAAMHTAARDGDERRPAMIRARATLAVAHARAGEVETARTEIARAITDAETLGSPALGALARSAAAEIAIATRDPEALRHHRARAALWCRSTSNPALIGRLARLSDDPDTTTEDDDKPSPDDDVATKVD